MILIHHKIYFNITRENTFLNNLRSLLNRNPVMYNSSAILPGSSFLPAFTMLQKVVDLLIGLIRGFITAFTLPDPSIRRFYTHGAFTRTITFNADDRRTTFFLRKPLNSLFFHLGRKLRHLMLNGMSLIRFTLGIGCNIITCCSTSLGNIPAKLSAYSRRMNPNFPGNNFCFIPAFKKASI
jgi:hypothetical protein